jgi:2',3'-cyclic-nucleotide 2'-phosphodiesterase (5'-nucleotidase family)
MGDYIYNVGYQDLAAGFEFIKEMEASYGTQYVSSNILKAGTDELAFNPHKIIKRGELNIGIFGLTTKLPSSVNAIMVKDYIQTAKEKIAELRPQVDVLVMLLNATRIQNIDATNDFAGVDYIFSSRETTRTRPETVKNTGEPMAYCFGIQGKYIARFDVNISDKGKEIKDITAPMMTASFFEKGLNNLQKRDPDKPLEKIYQNNPNVLKMVQQYKQGLVESNSGLNNVTNRSFYTLIPLNGGVASEKNLLAVVDQTLKTCNTLDKEGAINLN